MKPTTTLNVKKSNYEAVVNLANRVVGSLTGNLNFLTPIPALATVQTDITSTINAIAAWGPVGNRGSHAQLLALRADANTLYNDLLTLAAYVQNTAQATAGNDYVSMAAIIGSSGFSIKNPPAPQGILGAPQNLHRFFANAISLYTPKLKWTKPIGLTSANNVKSYQILRSLTNNILVATVIATSTKTSFIDTSALAATQYYYWVKGVNTDGAGAESNVLATSTPA
jgi:hypothetical protein